MGNIQRNIVKWRCKGLITPRWCLLPHFMAGDSADALGRILSLSRREDSASCIHSVLFWMLRGLVFPIWRTSLAGRGSPESRALSLSLFFSLSLTRRCDPLGFSKSNTLPAALRRIPPPVCGWSDPATLFRWRWLKNRRAAVEDGGDRGHLRRSKCC